MKFHFIMSLLYMLFTSAFAVAVLYISRRGGNFSCTVRLIGRGWNKCVAVAKPGLNPESYLSLTVQRQYSHPLLVFVCNLPLCVYFYDLILYTSS